MPLKKSLIFFKGCIHEDTMLCMGDIVNNFDLSYPFTFLETELMSKLDNDFFKGFAIVKVSFCMYGLNAAITFL